MKTLKDFENKLKELQEEFEAFKKTYKKAPEIGEKIEIAEIEWTVIDKFEEGYFCIGEIVKNSKFGANNDWRESHIRTYLNNEIKTRIEKEIGVALPLMERNLLSMDGQTEYGNCSDAVSIITVDEYRAYRKYIPNIDKWWWTITPDSTPCNKDSEWIRVVSPSGNFGNGNYDGNGGVRPVCIFPSSIFES